MMKDIEKLIPVVDKTGSFHTRTHMADNELIQSILINNIGNNDPQPCNYSPECKGQIPESPPPFERPSPKEPLPPQSRIILPPKPRIIVIIS